MLSCPICNDWCVSAKLCEKCYKIRNLYALYGDKIYDVLERCLIIKTKEKINEEINKPVTRSETRQIKDKIGLRALSE